MIEIVVWFGVDVVEFDVRNEIDVIFMGCIVVWYFCRLLEDYNFKLSVLSFLIWWGYGVVE